MGDFVGGLVFFGVVGIAIWQLVKYLQGQARERAALAEEWESAVEARLGELRAGGFPTASDAAAAGVRIKADETIYGIFGCERYIQKTVTKRIQYAGPTLRIRLAKGLYYRAGDLNIGRVTEDVMEHKGAGMLVVTDKRVVFSNTGPGPNWTRTWNSLIGWDVAEDQIIFEPANGNAQVFDTTVSRSLGTRFVDGDIRCAAFILEKASPQ
jgi:hypothetical protein